MDSVDTAMPLVLALLSAAQNHRVAVIIVFGKQGAMNSRPTQPVFMALLSPLAQPQFQIVIFMENVSATVIAYNFAVSGTTNLAKPCVFHKGLAGDFSIFSPLGNIFYLHSFALMQYKT